MHPGDALVHALPVLLELAQDLRDGCHRNASSLDAAPRGALERSHAAAPAKRLRVTKRVRFAERVQEHVFCDCHRVCDCRVCDDTRHDSNYT